MTGNREMPVAEMVKDLAAHHGPMETVACVRPCESFWADQGHRVGLFNTYLLNLIESVLEPNNLFFVSLIYKINTWYDAQLQKNTCTAVYIF